MHSPSKGVTLNPTVKNPAPLDATVTRQRLEEKASKTQAEKSKCKPNITLLLLNRCYLAALLQQFNTALRLNRFSEPWLCLLINQHHSGHDLQQPMFAGEGEATLQHPSPKSQQLKPRSLLGGDRSSGVLILVFHPKNTPQSLTLPGELSLFQVGITEK